MCVLTVAELTSSDAAISTFDQPLATGPEYLELALGELRPDPGTRLVVRLTGERLDEVGAALGGEEGLAGGDDLDGVDAGSSAGVSLSRKPLAPARSASIDVLIDVERRQDEDPGGTPSWLITSVAARPSSTGMRMSIRTTSGCRLADELDRRRAVVRLADDLEVRGRFDDRPESAAHEGFVVDDGNSDHGWITSSTRSAGKRPEPSGIPIRPVK